MTRSLYFIPLIESALGQREPGRAMTEAFEKIESLGRKPAYAAGFKMFLMFLSEVSESWKIQQHLSAEAAATVLDDLTLQTAAEMFEKDSLGANVPYDRADMPKGLLEFLNQHIRSFPIIGDDSHRMELDIIRKSTCIASFDLDLLPPPYLVYDVLPGTFKFALGSGRVLWEVTLAEKDLFISRVDPGQNLRFAADSNVKHPVRPTREMAVWGSELTFRVFAGLESGRIEIDMRKPL